MKTPVVNPYESPQEPAECLKRQLARTPGAVLIAALIIFVGCLSVAVFSVHRLREQVEPLWVFAFLTCGLMSFFELFSVVFHDRRSTIIVGGRIFILALCMMVPLAMTYPQHGVGLSQILFYMALLFMLPLGTVKFCWAHMLRQRLVSAEQDLTT